MSSRTPETNPAAAVADAVPWPEPELRSDRVLLRPWLTCDLRTLVANGRDPSVARWFPVIPCRFGESDAIAWLRREEQTRRTGSGIAFALADPSSGEALGGVGLGDIDRLLRSASIGYWLGAEARGQGRMSSALRLIAGWAFGTLELVRLQASIDPENLASRRVAERCGFRCEGRLRSSTIIRRTGERRDALVYGLLAGELELA